MGFARQLGLELRLQLRNRLGLAYGFLVPAMFLLAFWILYRHEPVPVVRHLGELLTVTVLAGACFSFPLAIVNEREIGVWRRYGMLPVSPLRLLASALVGRYVLLCAAALLQVVLAVWMGMPIPVHPFALWVAFTVVSFAFLGLGLLIATVADTVTAAQALGQSVFLPMLILGGVAVPLETMPEWVHHLSAFLPGRYAVAVIDQSVAGETLGAGWFSVASLVLMGAAAFLAGAKLFRSDTKQRLPIRAEIRWVAAALAGWVTVGVGSELGGGMPRTGQRTEKSEVSSPAFVRQEQPGTQDASGRSVASRRFHPVGDTLISRVTEVRSAAWESSHAAGPAIPAISVSAAAGNSHDPIGAHGDTSSPPSPTTGDISPPALESSRDPGSSPWRGVTLADVERDLLFDRLPPDAGLLAPIAPASYRDDPFVADRLECIARMLPEWKPAAVADPLQRVRNLLYVAAVPDVLQMQDIESVVPLVVFERLEQDIPAEELVQILYWIAMHPYDGDVSATERLLGACLDVDAPADVGLLRSRTGVYAAKLLGRLTGKLTPR
jgi:hypothetical protein